MPCSFMVGKYREPDMKQPILKSLKAIEDHISTEASDAEMLAITVAREIVSQSTELAIKDAIRATRQH